MRICALDSAIYVECDKLLHDAQVMIMTSDHEGTPMVALEAMALGVPIVSTPTDGLKDLIDDGRTGFLADDDSVLAGRLIELSEDEQLRKACPLHPWRELANSTTLEDTSSA
ncbi:MAG: glycosyltransferase family 4 protein [Clostridia bacterium]|nr:glycosyltransferase family 4 protein [Clostridia bacterium]